MPEFRKDAVSGRWVIFSPERKQRPQEFPTAPELPGINAFLSGHEHLTPAEVYSIRSPGSQANAPGWRVRVVPNRFPALRIEGELVSGGAGLFDHLNGIGAHEVIIETPQAGQQLATLPPDHVVDVLKAWRARMLDLTNDPRFRSILVFKNHGSLAGASLAHAHSQLMALPLVPEVMKQTLTACRRYYQEKERGLHGDLLRQELQDGSRMVFENATMAAFCPYASRFPFEICLLPKRSSPDFQGCSDTELAGAAQALQFCLQRLQQGLGDFHYNLTVQTAPLRLPRGHDWPTLDADFRWHIEILPRLNSVAAFELGTGFYINSTLPEEAAAFLRGLPAT